MQAYLRSLVIETLLTARGKTSKKDQIGPGSDHIINYYMTCIRIPSWLVEKNKLLIHQSRQQRPHRKTRSS